MKISVLPSPSKTITLAAFVFENEPVARAISGSQSWIVSASEEGFKAKENSAAIVHPQIARIILIGLGDRKKFNAETLRRAAATAIKKAQSISLKSLEIILPQVLTDPAAEFSALVEGSVLANYKFSKYKSEKENVALENLSVICGKKSALCRKILPKVETVCRAIFSVRDWVNEPPSSFTPKDFARAAEKVASNGKDSGISITVYDRKQIEKMQMGALLGVARGSAEDPVFIHLKYQPKRARKKIAFVGKGVTFDSGGLSLKPAQSMETMKMDMAGAAAILGLFQALPAYKPAAEIHGILAVTENMPGSRAYKPGDVLRSMSGKTIEVLNTDAEGRVILADALTYAVQQKVDEIIDLATLTGACLVALGGKIAGAMTNTPSMFDRLLKASKHSGEKFWQLPLAEEYRDGLKSPIADLQNISSVRGEAGAIIGGLFLQSFVETVPWMHLDIAGPAWTDREFSYCARGATAFPLRTLLHYLEI